MERRKTKDVRKKASAIGIVVLVLALGSIIFLTARRPYFSRLVTQMLREYRYADNAVAVDGSYLKIDTNPYDKPLEELEIWQMATFEQKQKDSLLGIKFVNEKLGFSEVVYLKMIETSALMGRQTAESKKYTVSWSYHPDTGLETIYEKK